MEWDYYRTLECKRDATTEDLKKAHRRLAFQYHPDRNAGNSEAETKFKQVQAAYETLSDPVKRHLYDAKHPYAGTVKSPKKPAKAWNEGFTIVHVDIGEVDLWKQLAERDAEDQRREEERKKNPPPPPPPPKPAKAKAPPQPYADPRDPNLGKHTIKNAPPPKRDLWGNPIGQNQDGWKDAYARYYERGDAPDIRGR